MKVLIQTNRVGLIKGRLEYTLDFVNNHPFIKGKIEFNTTEGNDHNYLLICGSGVEMIMKANRYLFAEKPYHQLPSPFLNRYSFNRETYWGISGIASPPSEVVCDNDISFDIFEAIFFHISRIEETIIPQEEYLGRKEVFEGKFNVIESRLEKTPIVDDLTRLLLELLTGEKIKRKSTLAISHDVDIIQKFQHPISIFRKVLGHFYHRKSFKGFGSLVAGYMDYLRNHRDPYDTSSWMLIKDESIEKQIYFLSGGSHRWDTPYDFDHSVFKNFLVSAKENKYKIGIHPSYESWNNGNLVEKEKDRLEQYVDEEITCSRQHFLNFDIRVTPKLLLKAGIKKDSSLGFTRHIGFRCGTGFPYFLYDFEKEVKSELLEDPLAFMDSACLYESEFNSEKFVERMRSFFEQNNNNTRILCNFHNSFFDEAIMRGIPLKAMYENLIASFATHPESPI